MAADGYLTGKLLIASPAIGDPRFDRALIYVCDHDDEHAMGIAINNPVEDLRLPLLFEQLGIESEIHLPDQAVLKGGPVDGDRGFVLHTPDFSHENATLRVSGNICLTATRDVLDAMASDHPPLKSVLALGYAGWGPGQLEDELQASAWLVADPEEALIFDDHFDDKWERALHQIGVNPAHLSAVSGHA
jgi:putative transcriptional regulator